MQVRHVPRLRAVTIADQLGGVTGRVFDTDVRVMAVTDPFGPTTAEYDAAGRQTRETDPDGHVTAWTYDLNGTRHDGGGNQTFVPGGRDHVDIIDSWPLAPRPEDRWTRPRPDESG